MKKISKLLGVIKSHPGKKALGKALSVSVLNQVVSSGTNFALGIYLVRTLPPAEFGLYGIGFAVSLFYAGIGHALFLMQMVIHTPNKVPEDRLPYAGRMFLLVALFCSITVLLGILVFLVGCFVWEPVTRYAEFASAIMAASVAYLLKDFFVRHAYNVRRETWALAIHSATAFTTAGLLLMQYRFITSFNSEMAMWIYATAQISGAWLGYLFARLPVAMRPRSALYADLREAFLGGKWASITILVYFARTQAHTIVVASLLGSVGVAKLNAARLLVTPAVMLTPALGQVAMPRLAAVREQSERRLMTLGLLITFALLVVVLLYCALLLGSYDWIVDKILGENYQGLFVMIALWCLYTCLLALRNGAEMVGQVLKKFRDLNRANIYGAIVSLIVTYWLTVGYGLTGALIGLAMGEIVLIILLYYLLLTTLFFPNSDYSMPPY